MDKYSHLTEGWYTQEEAWTKLKIGRTTWYRLKKKHGIKARKAEGVRILRISREDLIEADKMLYKERFAPSSEPEHLKAKREKKPKGKD